MTKKEETFNWLKFAIEDLKAAKSFLSKEELMPRHACWLAQQAAGKVLKSVLVFEQIKIPKTHDLEYLLTLIPEKWNLHKLNSNLESLTEWAVEARYPGDWDEASEEDAIFAVKNAEIIVNEIKSTLQSTKNDD